MKLKHLLLTALCAVVSVSAWATDVPYNVGSQETPGTYLVTNSDEYDLVDGSSWHFVFTNYNNNGGNWNNWALAGNDKAGTNYFVVRNDNWENVAGANTNCTSDFNWDNFPAQMNGAVVDMTVSRLGNVVTMTSTITTTASAVYHYSYHYDNATAATVGLVLTTDQSWMTITEATYAAPATPAIRTLPANMDFKAGGTTNPFIGGAVVTGTKLTDGVMNVNNTTATAWFDADANEEGNQPYELANNEEVTVSFVAYHGWLTRGSDQGVKLINSDGVEIASYYYNLNGCNVTNVKLGDATPAEFAAFGCQSWCATSNKNANGLTNNPYNVQDANNTVVTMKVAKSGKVSISFVNGHFNVNKTFNGELADAVKKDIAKIVVFSNSNNGDRTICVDNFSITSEIKSNPAYTVRYENENGDAIMSPTSGDAVAGSQVAVEQTPIWVGGQKYYYVSDDSETNLVAADGSTVVTVIYRAAENYNWTVTSSMSTPLGSGVCVEGENVTISVPRYINVDGTLYETAKNGNDWYHHSYTITSNNQAETVTYNATAYTNVVFYAEAESLAGAVSGSGNGTRTSNGLTAYGTNLPVTTLPAGSYKIYIHGANGNSSDRAVAFKNGENPVAEFTIAHNNNNQDHESAVFTLTENADITLTSEGSSASGVDFFFIQQISSATMTVSATAQYGTFCAPFAVEVPAGVTASTATIDADGETIVLASVGATIPANTPVILYAEEGLAATTVYGKATAIMNPTAGVLVGTYSDIQAPNGSYVLQMQDHVAFYLVDTSVAQPMVRANRAYLTVPSAAKPRMLRFGSDEETVISAIEALTSGKAEIYSVNGVKLNKLQKGINIVNGKKIMVK